MVGNDVIDLAAPESASETLHPRFDARVFGAPERKSIADARDPSRQRWRLWAAKEAAFKLARQHDPRTVFSPIRFETCFEAPRANVCRGGVRHEDHRYRVRIEDGPRFIHALAIDASGRFGDVVASVRLRAEVARPWAIRRDDESAAVRGLVCDDIGHRLGFSSDELEVRREGRVPSLWRGGERLSMSLSLSHHGDFIAYAYLEAGARK